MKYSFKFNTAASKEKKTIVTETRLRSVHDIHMSSIYIYSFVKSVAVTITSMPKAGPIFLHVIFPAIKDIRQYAKALNMA